VVRKTDKCPHDHLIVHSKNNEGVWFYAQCAECGLCGGDAPSPHSASTSFNKRLGRRSVKLAKKKMIKQYVLTSLGLAFIIAFMAVLFMACGPQVAGGG